MNWKLDNIDFKDYGVYVSKASGVIDLPKVAIPSHDWLDEDGKEYWTVEADYLKKDREIRLSCIIVAGNLADFETKVAAFWAVLSAENNRQLSCDYLTTSLEVYLHKKIVTTRRTSWNQDKQAGVFTLGLTVSGDSEYSLINISRFYSYSVVAVAKTKNLTINKTLQGDLSASMSFESNTKLDIQAEDFIQYEYNGNGFDRFILNSEPQFVKKSSNLYVYNLKFDHRAPLYLSRAQFLSDLYESDFYWYGNLGEIIDQLVWNYGRRGYNSFVKGAVPSTVKKNHKFTNEDCLSVLKRICAEYKLEYEFVNGVSTVYNINVAQQVANDTGVSFEYGKGKGFYTVERGERLKGEYCNKLFAFGASKNLKPEYRNGLKRLSFDGNPLLVAGDPIEKTVFFEDIFPQRTATVTGYVQKLPDQDPEQLTIAEKEVWPNGIFRVVDTSIDFDLNDYLLGGLTAKIRMKTGDLAGYEFEINLYDHDSQEINITRFKDERGEMLPNELLQIAIGDEYTLIDIDQPASYIVTAETALEAAATDYIAEHSIPKFQYKVKVDPKFILDNPMTFEVGDRITVVDADYTINGLFRISNLSFNESTGIYDLTLSDKTQYPRLTILESAVREHERALLDTGATEVETMKKDQMTTGELGGILLDPNDEKLNVDNIVRNNSLDPGMISFDTDVPFYIKDAVIEANRGGLEDALRIESGEIIITNWNCLSRYKIAKLKSGGGTYDPTRKWIISQTDISLLSKDSHWLYAKLNIAEGSTACTIEAHSVHVEGKELIDTDYLYKRLANITSGEE